MVPFSLSAQARRGFSWPRSCSTPAAASSCRSGRRGAFPVGYRGRGIFGWLLEVIRDGGAHGATLPTAEQLPDGRRKFSAMPALTGRDGGHDTNLRQFAADGMTLGGRLVGASGERVTFAGDLTASLEQSARGAR